jgi:hypothetical protein
MLLESNILTGENITLITKQILLPLENDQENILMYKIFEARKTAKKL